MKSMSKNSKAPNNLPSARKQIVFIWFVRILILLVSFLLCTSILIAERDPKFSGAEITVGEPAPRTFFSPLNLTYVNEGETQLLREEKRKEILPVLRRDPAMLTDIREKTTRFLTKLGTEKENRLAGKPGDLSNFSVKISEAAMQYLLTDAALDETGKALEMLYDKGLNQMIVKEELKGELLKSGAEWADAVDLEGEKRIALRDITTVEDVKNGLPGLAKNLIADKSLREAAGEIFSFFLSANLTLDEAETKSRRRKAAESVEAVKESIKKNELIIQRGMLVTPKIKEKLDWVHKALAKQKVLSKFIAVGLLVFLTYLFGAIYIFMFDRKTFFSIHQTLLIHSIYLLTVLFSKIVIMWTGGAAYLMPVALAALLMALLLNPQIALLSGAAVVILTSPLAEFSADVIVGGLLASAAAVLTALHIRKRSHFLRAGIVIGLAYFVVLFAFQIFQEYPAQESLMLSVQGFANGLLITMPLAFLLLPILEYIFGLVTDITLLETSDLNHPLLKKMIVEAPGTYHHSLVVSTLAESASQQIGANALLARVGCYFHDIGKIARSEYFTENASNIAARNHEKLTPAMSCRIIHNHVKEGIALGKKYKLRDPILKFIPEHQGTGVVYYFYKKAVDQAKHGETVNPDEFRYPGPKPQSRETAIALLADSTEAASRSLKDPTPESIRELVRKIINDKFIDGQLDECNLTLRDLHRIEDSFVHNLMAIFHTRVRYPSKPENPNNPDLFKGDDFAKYRVCS